MTAAVYAAALRYADRGVAVFPVEVNGKRPLTAHGVHDASTDPNVIGAWWRRHPRANLAIATGSRSGLVAIDLDTKRGADWRATVAGLERDFGELPATLASETPSGGEHRWFRIPAGAVIRNGAGRVLGEDAPGFDWRADGGYVLAPPSKIDGRAYVWRDRLPTAELPVRWVEALAPAKRRAERVEPWRPTDAHERDRLTRWCVRALQQEARALAEAPTGTRNDRLWRSVAAIAGLVHVGAYGASDVRHAMQWACSQWHPRDARKDLDTIERAMAFGLANPRHVSLPDGKAA